MSEQIIRDRYRGLGGLYVIVDDEKFPADEAGNPLPHTRDENGAPISPPPAPEPDAPQE